jgi:hypothetical protein
MTGKKLLILWAVLFLVISISLFLAHTGLFLLAELGFHFLGTEFNWPSADILIRRLKAYSFAGFLISIFYVFVMWRENRNK